MRGPLFSAFDGQLTRLEGLVIVRAEPQGMTAEQSEAAARFEAGLISGVTAAGVPVVGVELSNGEVSQVSWYKEHNLSSVDDVDAAAGQTALAYALAGDHGTFGVKPTADSLLPTVGSSAGQP